MGGGLRAVGGNPIEIEPLVDPGPRPEPSEESVVRMLNSMTELFRKNTEVLSGPEERLPSFVGRGYNRFGEPSFWGGKEDGGGWERSTTPTPRRPTSSYPTRRW